MAEGKVSVNKRKEGDKGQMTVAQFLKMTAEDRKLNSGITNTIHERRFL